MKYTTTPVSAPESTILAADTYVAIPFTVTESGVVKAGYPMAKTGKKASATTGVPMQQLPMRLVFCCTPLTRPSTPTAHC